MNKADIKKPIVRTLSRNQLQISQRLNEMIMEQTREIQRKNSESKPLKNS